MKIETDNSERSAFLLKILIILVMMLNAVSLLGSVATWLLNIILSIILVKLIKKDKNYYMIIPVFLSLMPLFLAIIGFLNQPYIYEKRMFGLPLFYLYLKLLHPYSLFAIGITAIFCSVFLIQEGIKDYYVKKKLAQETK